MSTKTGLRLDVVGLGCMGMSWGYSEGSRDDQQSRRAIQTAVGLGIGHLDTAAVYGDGHNERLVGEALEGDLQHPLIATKGGLVVDDLRTRRMHRDGRPEATSPASPQQLAAAQA